MPRREAATSVAHGQDTREGHSALSKSDQQKQILSERLRALMDAKGLTVTAVSKLMIEKLEGETFNSANISHYRAGRSLPRPRILKALSEVLGVTPDELLPLGEIGPTTSGSAHSEAGYGVVKFLAGNSLEFRSPPQGEVPAGAAPVFQIEDLPGGEAWLRVSLRLPWPTVIKILQVLKGEKTGDDEARMTGTGPTDQGS